jgi:pectin methylesterase-like acyl-CoA thioesterase
VLRRSLILAALLFLVPLLVRAQVTRTVGQGQAYTSVQSAIDASSYYGDTVVVQPGTYYEHIDFKGKAITVTGTPGAAASTVINGSGPRVCRWFCSTTAKRT